MKQWSIGIGTTDECNLNCPHCYSRTPVPSRLSVEDVTQALQIIQPAAVNFGTGENILNPDFPAIIDTVHSSGCKMSLTSNGLSLLRLPDDILRLFSDVDVSIDYPDQATFERFRGKGAWKLAMAGLERALSLGVDTSIAACVMNVNYKSLPQLIKLAAGFGVTLRLNIFKPVYTDQFILSYEEFWYAIKLAFASAKVVSCSEPVVAVCLSDRSVVRECGCGQASMRIRPDKKVVPCVYWQPGELTIDGLAELVPDLEFDLGGVPADCRDCEFVSECRGGCAGRRLYRGLDKPDEYCSLLRGKPEVVDCEPGTQADLVHAGYLCTIILEP